MFLIEKDKDGKITTANKIKHKLLRQSNKSKKKSKLNKIILKLNQKETRENNNKFKMSAYMLRRIQPAHPNNNHHNLM